MRQQRSAGEQKAAHGDNPLKTKPGNVLPATHVKLPASAAYRSETGRGATERASGGRTRTRVPTAPARPAPPTERPGQHLPGTTEPTASACSPRHVARTSTGGATGCPRGTTSGSSRATGDSCGTTSGPRGETRATTRPRRLDGPQQLDPRHDPPPRRDRPQQLDPRHDPPPRLDRLPGATGSKVTCRVPIRAPTTSTGSSLSSNDLWFAHLERKPMNLKSICLSLSFCLVLLIGQGTSGQDVPVVSHPVQVSQPLSHEVVDYADFTGRSEAAESVEVLPRVSGRIDKVAFVPGAAVKQGDLLFEIDPRPYQADLDKTEAEAGRAEARAKRLAAAMEQAKTLLAAHAITQEAFDRIAADREDVEAAVQAVTGRAGPRPAQPGVDEGYGPDQRPRRPFSPGPGKSGDGGHHASNHRFRGADLRLRGCR